MKPYVIILTQHLALLAPLWALSGCAVDDMPPPPLGHNPQTTAHIQQAGGALMATLNKCKGGIQSKLQGATASRAFGVRPSQVDDSACWNDLVNTLLVWRQAPKQDGTLAINDPYYRSWLAQTMRRFFNKTARDLALTKEQQLSVMAQLFAGFNSTFVPSARRLGAIVGSDLSLILAAMQGQGTALVDSGARSLPPPKSNGPKYSIGYFR